MTLDPEHVKREAWALFQGAPHRDAIARINDALSKGVAALEDLAIFLVDSKAPGVPANVREATAYYVAVGPRLSIANVVATSLGVDTSELHRPAEPGHFHLVVFPKCGGHFFGRLPAVPLSRGGNA